MTEHVVITFHDGEMIHLGNFGDNKWDLEVTDAGALLVTHPKGSIAFAPGEWKSISADRI